MPCPEWTIDAPAAQGTTYLAATSCLLHNVTPGAGIVLTQDGVNFSRTRVDDDGAIVTEGVAGPGTSDFYWSTPGTGPIFAVGSVSDIVGTMYRLEYGGQPYQIDGVLLAGWETNPLLYGMAFALDVVIVGIGNGIVLTTPDSLHTYEVRCDVDGTLISEGIS